MSKIIIPSYCTQNNGNCQTCSLVNYGRDCQNKPVKNKEQTMKVIETKMTPDRKGHIIAYSNAEWSTLGWNHWHRIVSGKNKHEFQSSADNCHCEKCGNQARLP